MTNTGHKGWLAATLTGLSMLLAASAPAIGADNEDAADAQSVIANFDMGELYQPLPKNFRRARGDAFYHWIHVALDRKIGHTAPPSLRIDLRRGNGGCEHLYNQIKIRPYFNYRLEAWVRTAGLKRARAYVTAFFVDASGKKIPQTVRVSPLLGGGTNARWHKITLLLAANSPRYRHLSFGMWLTQPWKVPGTRKTDAGKTPEDISGSAWFDDVRVYALPKIRLFTSAAGNVFAATERVTIHAEISGVRFENLLADLSIHDATGKEVTRRRQVLPNAASQVNKLDMPLADLPSGWYRVTLRLEDGGRTVSRRETAFVRLAQATGRPSQRGKQFGVVLATAPKNGSPAIDILTRLGVGRCKLPLWEKHLTDEQMLYLRPQIADTLLKLAQRRIRCVGMFNDAPPLIRERFYRRIASTADIFSAGEEHWKNPLAMTLTYYAAKINQWQLGPDTDTGFSGGPKAATALRQVTPQFVNLVARPEIGLPWAGTHSTHDPVGKTAQFISLYLDARSNPLAVRHIVKDAVSGAAKPRVWVTLEPPAAESYRRKPRLIRFARRVVEALAGGAENVFVPQPWRNRATNDGGPWPDELMVVYHTLADQLGGAKFIGRLRLHENVQCFVFDRDQDALLVGWIDGGLQEKMSSSLYLGGNSRYVDLWGRQRSVTTTEGKAAITFTTAPVFISGIDARIARTRGSFKIVPALLDSDFVTHQAQIEFVNGFQQTVTGSLRLQLPNGWHIAPMLMRFVLAPGKKFTRKISLRFPYNATAGNKLLRGDFQIDGERSYNFSADAPFELALAGTTSRIFAQISGKDVLVDMAVTNFRAESRQFDCVAMAPGHATQQRSIGALTRGQTIVKRFRFTNAANLLGKRVRVTLREVDGSHVANYETVVR